MWARFYRKSEQYAKGKHWSSQECKSNLIYVLQGKAAIYLAYLIELVANLPYYDFIMQMKQYMESQDLFTNYITKEHLGRFAIKPVFRVSDKTDSNQSPQIQRQARQLKFRSKQV